MKIVPHWFKYIGFAICIGVLLIPLSATGQVRYLDEVFDEVDVENDIIYGKNATVLYYTVFNKAVDENLLLDVYMPSGDQELERPLVIYVHNGNFIPFHNPADTQKVGFNGMCVGERTDSSVVEICSRLARMGYVVASMDYRLGWNPLGNSTDKRKHSFVNAVYRGTQDTRTAIRYFRRSVVEMNNPYGIDTSRIVLWGEGTGGVITLSATMLDNQDKFLSGTNGKFLWDHDEDPLTPSVSVVQPEVNGDINGTSLGINPIDGDTFCHPNHVGYSSDFHLQVNLGGFSLDSGWMESGQTPLISLALALDYPSPPYGDGKLISAVHFFVMDIHGSYSVQKKAQQLGTQNVMLTYGQEFDLGEEQTNAFSYSKPEFKDPLIGLYPLHAQDPDSGYPDPVPWEWASLFTNNSIPWANCKVNKSESIAYIDTIIRFYAPRACLVLGLSDCIASLTGTVFPDAPQSDVIIFPNPATDNVSIQSSSNLLIEDIKLYDFQGRLKFSVYNINHITYQIERSVVPQGASIALIRLSSGESIRKLLIF